MGDESAQDTNQIGSREDHFREETATNHQNERYDEGLYVSEALVLKVHHRQDIQRRDAHSPNKRNPKEQIQSNNSKTIHPFKKPWKSFERRLSLPLSDEHPKDDEAGRENAGAVVCCTRGKKR